MLTRILTELGSSAVVTGIASVCGIIGFLLTIIVTFRTAKISRILKYNNVTALYNKERKGFLKAFEGHRQSIQEDGIRTDKLLKDILSLLEEYRLKFADILTVREKITLLLFSSLLQKDADKVNWNSVCNYLAKITGRLSKKEEKKNG